MTEAALHIIATRGVAALSTRGLAEQVGLTSGAIFRHFPSLEALLEAVVARVEAVLDATYPESGLPPRERLAKFVHARSTVVGQQLGILRLMLSEQFSLALPEAGSVRLARCVKNSREFVLRCLREGQAAGEFRSDIDASVLSAVVLGTMQMLALSSSMLRLRPAEAQSVREGLLTLLQPSPLRRPKGVKKSA